jgi:hypothetical protein
MARYTKNQNSKNCYFLAYIAKYLQDYLKNDVQVGSEKGQAFPVEGLKWEKKLLLQEKEKLVTIKKCNFHETPCIVIVKKMSFFKNKGQEGKTGPA